jgi:hypothetical protein
MKDPKERDPKAVPADTLEDDAIIELVDEVEGDGPPETVTLLEKQLLDLPGDDGGHAFRPQRPDSETGEFRFDEQEEPPPLAERAGSPSGGSISLEDAEWLFADDTGRTAKAGRDSSNAIVEISEFDEQFLDPEETPSLKPAPAPGSKDEPLELLDLEEDELDNELLWFDDLKPEAEPPTEQPSGLAEHEEIELILPEEADLGPTSAADVFSAHLDSIFPEGDRIQGRDGIPFQVPADEADSGTAPPGSEPQGAAAAIAGVQPEPGIVIPAVPPVSQSLPQSAPAGIPPEEIEAAVERVIERKLGGTIEATILRVIETAVNREIERLKQLLLEDDKP